MTTIQQRQELHDYIEKADDRLIKLIYGMITADASDEFELTDQQKKTLEDRLKSYRSGASTVTWDEVKANLPGKE